MSNRRDGVYDPGAVANGYQEADIALQYAITLGYILRQRGFSVRYTRTTNTDPAPLRKRVESVAGAHALISLHLNASTDAQAHGAETLYRTQTAQHFAQAIHNAHLRAFPQLHDRGLKQRSNLAILKFEPYACLLELGFITHPRDINALVPPSTNEQDNYRQQRIRWAHAIADALEALQWK